MPVRASRHAHVANFINFKFVLINLMLGFEFTQTDIVVWIFSYTTKTRSESPVVAQGNGLQRRMRLF